MVKRWALSCLLVCAGCSLRDLDYLEAGRTSLCPDGGWCRLPGTALRPQCPLDSAESGYARTCASVILQSSGVWDAARHRMVVWGGGYDHYGNELYALSIADGTMRRLDDPRPTDCHEGDACGSCIAEPVLPDGTPHPRITRDGLAAATHAGVMVAVGGEVDCGFFYDTWTLDLDSLTWTARTPAGPPGCDPETSGSCGPGFPSTVGMLTDYDPVTRAVYVKDSQQLWKYVVDEDRYELLRDDVTITYPLTGRVDPVHRFFVYVGAGQLGAISIDPSFANVDWTPLQSGCEALMNADGPGLAWDERHGRLVGWPNQGDSVYTLELNGSTPVCTPITYPGGPPAAVDDQGAPVVNDTYGRFRYVPEADVFLVIDDVDDDAFVLRL